MNSSLAPLLLPRGLWGFAVLENLQSMNPIVAIIIGVFGGGALTGFVIALFNGRRADRDQEFNHLNIIVNDLRTRIVSLESDVEEYAKNHAVDKEKIGRLETGLAECQLKHERDERQIKELRTEVHTMRSRLATCSMCHGQLPSPPEKSR